MYCRLLGIGSRNRPVAWPVPAGRVVPLCGSGRFPARPGPAGLELQVIATVCPTGLDLEGFLRRVRRPVAAQGSSSRMFVFHPRELVLFRFLALLVSDTNCRSGMP